MKGKSTALHKAMVLGLLAMGCAAPGRAQVSGSGALDPARDPARLQAAPASTVTAQFVWTAGDAAARDPALQARVRGQEDKIAPHFFRARFTVPRMPAEATLYLAGPRSATVWLNGVEVLQFADDGKRTKGFAVQTAAVAQALHAGQNVLAVELVRGHGSLHTGANAVINQVTYGEVLLAKIVPRADAVDAPPLVVSDPAWRSVLAPAEGWQQPGFDDSAWPRVEALGVAGSRDDFLQWNADAGLYAWPGYAGIGAAMRVFPVSPKSVTPVGAEEAAPDKDTAGPTHRSARKGAQQASSDVLVDFGEEIGGRVHLLSRAVSPLHVETSYGESAGEALHGPYLGVRDVTIPAQGEAWGPKSAFRFVRLRFGSAGEAAQVRVDAQGIAYPVQYRGWFRSSDPLLNRIWETAAYTAHLTMAEGIWDAPKRDRGRWMGDLDVTGRTINDVFADRTLMEETMRSVAGPLPVERDVNTIAGYSALWVTGQAEFLRHVGDMAYLREMEPQLRGILHRMETQLDADGLFVNARGGKVFVDWSPGFSADGPEARAATHFEYIRAFTEAGFLLRTLGDAAEAGRYEALADRMREAARAHLLTANGTFGTRWQTDAAAIDADATAGHEAAAWKVLRTVNDPENSAVITPYYGFYVLEAMARLGHRADALQWMRSFWGGMLRLGATSFWEAYDPHWLTTPEAQADPHRFLEADGKTGYYVSLAHGWSSGPAPWLMGEVLGIAPTAPGFVQTTVRPDLAGLRWAEGGEPTPRGMLGVSVRPGRLRVTVPPATEVRVLLPVTPEGTVRENGREVPTTAAEGGTRSEVLLHASGTYRFKWTERAAR